LDGVLKYRAKDLVGICNGVDMNAWNPTTDKVLPENFSAWSLEGKKTCEQHLQRELDLSNDLNVPIFNVVSRCFH
jgi:starch synthase